MINFDDYTNENKTEDNQQWPYIPDHPDRILIIRGSGSGKTNLINNQPDIDKIYLYAKDSYETKYQFLIDKRESTGLKHCNDPETFIEYSNDMQDLCKNINEYNVDKECKTIVFDDMVAGMINNKNLNSVDTKLFIRGQKLNISFVFIMQSYFKVPKDTTQFFITKIPNKKELQQITLNHASDISSKDFIKIYKKCTAEPYSFFS